MAAALGRMFFDISVVDWLTISNSVAVMVAGAEPAREQNTYQIMSTHKIEFDAAEAARLTAEAIQEVADQSKRTAEYGKQSFELGIYKEDEWRLRHGKESLFKAQVIDKILQVFADSTKFNQIYQAAQISVTIEPAQEAENNG